jgi:hypothetical protein
MVFVIAGNISSPAGAKAHRIGRRRIWYSVRRFTLKER